MAKTKSKSKTKKKPEVRTSVWTKIMVSLAGLGITKITVEYSGGGDSGAIDSTIFEADGKILEDDEIPQDYKTKVEEKAYKLLEDFPDWYNDEGGGGSMVIEVPSGEYQCHHGIHRTETDYEDYEGNFLSADDYEGDED